MEHLEKKLDGNYAACYFEQILEAAPNKTVAVRPLTSHPHKPFK